MARKNTNKGPSGLVVIDKPAGMTSHDVVSRVRQLAGTRKVGHAGTLDPMATGVLILGVNKATKLLTWVVGESKTYTTTMRLGISTVTDDAEGEATALASPDALAAVTAEKIEDALTALRGEIMQVPSSVSAIKVNGVRSYARVRSGEEVSLEARPITVHSFEVHAVIPEQVEAPEQLVDYTGDTVPDYISPGQCAVVDVEATISCSSGTYIRALARDLGRALNTGAHLAALRRVSIGEVGIDTAATLEQLAFLKEQAPDYPLPMLSLEDSARRLFASRALSDLEATDISNGRRIAPSATQDVPSAHSKVSTAGLTAAFAPDGSLVAILENKKWRGEKVAAPVLVFESGKTYGSTS
ncbi:MULTISPECIES: tRNA pseudouridine(55) synthase TruB [unclassified Rothia (in: high G+C Gram-positive bacteria)]|uniref:tRNA pseudouridine(55) synthase TruB n=1 Tax=unclassified Rothia (in: high G+C Gram-positive bacteria) TaxID=2689056 RepID=UPI001956C13C|nr:MULTISPECIES: tRNA pseudouridine(55) synthase TruB [unclassified Rothia (in: high G+C Gram-positive bacteria)]MBM7051309.1 tRNA pseudouridine(55) synthase TruB [Rothia sp. ZJ1223]QRZ61100.1 tRNA pseudouridine(55) synthase TruB [Rothia sp. ZJ932]